MKIKRKISRALFTSMMLAGAINPTYAATANVKITEWMYQPVNSAAKGEFIEFTNLGSTAVSFSGWSFDDSTEVAGSYDLSAFGTVNAGESVILTDDTASNFRTTWGLSGSVKVIGGNTENLGRSDEMNIYDAANNLVDRLTYNDQGTGTVKGPRTASVSARPGSVAAIGANNASLWTLSTVGNGDGAFASLSGEIGSPGKTSYAVSSVPLPASLPMMLSGIALLGGLKLRRRC